MNYLLLNQKGGCGKTTTAFLLIAALHHAGRTLHYADLDPQKSLTAWLAIEGVKPSPSEIRITDTPPRCDDAQTIAAIKEAHKIIIPSSPSLADVQVSKSTVDLIKSLNPKAMVTLVWNRVQKNTIAARQLEDYAEAIGATALKAQITQRICYGAVPGLGWAALNREAREESLNFALEVLA